MSQANLPLRFSQFHQCHHPQEILVCGCGHSLRQIKTAPNITSIGVNDVGRHFTPTYLLVVNPPQDFTNGRYAYIQASRAHAVFSPYSLPLANAPLVSFRLGLRSGTDCHNRSSLPYTRNSPYMALCLAAYMGARRIGLLGVDFTRHHFFAATGTHPLTSELKWIDREYWHLGQALAQEGIEIVNLSRESRLTAFRKASLAEFLETSENPRLGSSGASLPRTWVKFNPAAKRSRLYMDITVERHGKGLAGQCFNQLADTLKNMGANVNRIPVRSGYHAPVTFVWNGRFTRTSGATIYCEHGWLPRWYFQMSPRGINAHSHCAPFIYTGETISSTNRALVEKFTSNLRTLGPKGYMAANAPQLQHLPKAFLLVPLQIEQDTNIRRHVAKPMRSMQRFIDYVSWHKPNLPILFKQHPADARYHNLHLRLKIRRRRDQLIAHHLGNIHQILKTGACKGIISLNSNVVHDGLIWDIPAVVLGRNIWPRSGPSPFLHHIPADYRALEHHYHQSRDCRHAYCLHLIRNQWSLEDLGNPEKLYRFIRQCTGWLDQKSA